MRGSVEPAVHVGSGPERGEAHRAPAAGALLSVFAAGLVALLAVAGCEDEVDRLGSIPAVEGEGEEPGQDAGRACTPGTSRPCACASDRTGVQTCTRDGSGWSTCLCYGIEGEGEGEGANPTDVAGSDPGMDAAVEDFDAAPLCDVAQPGPEWVSVYDEADWYPDLPEPEVEVTGRLEQWADGWTAQHTAPGMRFRFTLRAPDFFPLDEGRALVYAAPWEIRDEDPHLPPGAPYVPFAGARVVIRGKVRAADPMDMGARMPAVVYPAAIRCAAPGE